MPLAIRESTLRRSARCRRSGLMFRPLAAAGQAWQAPSARLEGRGFHGPARLDELTPGATLAELTEWEKTVTAGDVAKIDELLQKEGGRIGADMNKWGLISKWSNAGLLKMYQDDLLLSLRSQIDALKKAEEAAKAAKNAPAAGEAPPAEAPAAPAPTPAKQ